jgi:hypothetical protein
MRRTLPVLLASLALLLPAVLLAKGETVKICIAGGDLKAPVEITDPKILANFRVWSGPGTNSNALAFKAIAPGFIIEWSQGPIAGIPARLQRYEVSFYASSHGKGRIYVVYYEYDPSKGQGYVYLPGQTDEWYVLNVRTIYRGVEGKWFHAWKVWDQVAWPLISDAKATTASAAPY